MPLQATRQKLKSALNTVRQRTFRARARLAGASGDVKLQQDVTDSVALRKQLHRRLKSMRSEHSANDPTPPAPSSPSAIGEKRPRSSEGGHGVTVPPAQALETSSLSAPAQVRMIVSVADLEGEVERSLTRLPLSS